MNKVTFIIHGQTFSVIEEHFDKFLKSEGYFEKEGKIYSKFSKSRVGSVK